MNLIIQLLDMNQIIKDNPIISIKTIKKINEGSYGVIYLTNYKKLVIKIIKDNSKSNFLNEVSIFYKLKNIKVEEYPNHLIRYIGFGKIIDTNRSKYLDCNVLFMNLYYNFFELYSQLKIIPLIFFEDYKEFIIIFIYKILLINYFFEKKLNSVNIDIKLSNILSDMNDIIMIDLGMLVKIDKTLIENKNNNEIWPNGKTEIKYIPNYSIGKIIIYLLFHYKKYSIELDKEVKIILKLLLSCRYDTEYVLNFIKEHYYDIVKDI